MNAKSLFMSDSFPILLEVAEDQVGKRLDQFLAAKLDGVSRARVQQLIRAGQVRTRAGATVKRSYRLERGEHIEILGPIRTPPLRARAEQIPVDVVYEDDHLAVVNKPAGMMVHAGAGATDEARNRGTLVNALLHRFASLSEVGGELRPGIVHRLDRSTSGLMVVAKTDQSHRQLAEQFAARKAKKSYIALVHGWLEQDAGTIERNVSRDRMRRTRMTTRREGGRQAITHYRVLERLETAYGRFSLLEIRIETGRTHQIRVHLASLAHPVVGDTLYGAPRELTAQDAKFGSRERPPLALGRNFLHASTLQIIHPATGESLSFARPLPRELERFISRLQAKV